jgi:hypothetical protein
MPIVWRCLSNPEKGPGNPHRWYGPYIIDEVTNQGKCLKIRPGPGIQGIPQPLGIQPAVSVDRVKPFYYSRARTDCTGADTLTRKAAN